MRVVAAKPEDRTLPEGSFRGKAAAPIAAVVALTLAVSACGAEHRVATSRRVTTTQRVTTTDAVPGTPTTIAVPVASTTAAPMTVPVAPPLARSANQATVALPACTPSTAVLAVSTDRATYRWGDTMLVTLRLSSRTGHACDVQLERTYWPSGDCFPEVTLHHYPPNALLSWDLPCTSGNAQFAPEAVTVDPVSGGGVTVQAHLGCGNGTTTGCEAASSPSSAWTIGFTWQAGPIGWSGPGPTVDIVGAASGTTTTTSPPPMTSSTTATTTAAAS